MKIIIAEDEPIALRQMKRIVEKVCAGAEIYCFESAGEVFTTQRVIDEASQGKGIIGTFDSVESLMAELNA